MPRPKIRGILSVVERSSEACALSDRTNDVFFVEFSDGLAGPFNWEQIRVLLDRRHPPKEETSPVEPRGGTQGSKAKTVDRPNP